jgi:protein-arginine kinase activator protein McsA
MSEQKERFIAEAKQIHGDKYDYSSVVYNGPREKVSIICPEHGVFFQWPYSHITLSSGCHRCAIELRNKKTSSTTEAFIDKARLIHGDLYDYSDVVYTNSQTYVSIKCTHHGTFRQVPNAHLSGKGCPNCGGKIKLTTEEFISNATAVHGLRYDYSKSVYVTAKTPIEITCKTHGPFWQIPNNHTQGAGCPSCAPGMIFNTDEFIEKARKIHGEKYDYSNSKFVAVVAPIVIRCQVHGDFEQVAGEHLRGRGCKKCADKLTGQLNTLTTEEFVFRSKEKHGDTYDYSESTYESTTTAVKIICKVHGPFWQIPTNHLKGSGCRVCRSSKGELAIANILKKHDIEFIPEYQIPNQKYRYRYDFYVPSLNLLIEYHGIQHYEPVAFFGGRDGLIARILRDDVKRSLANVLRYKFLEVNYTNFLALSPEEFEKKLLLNIGKFKPRP